MAVRLQRKRVRGWEKPQGSIYVGRGTTFGNPFKVIADAVYVFANYRLNDPWIFYEHCGDAQAAKKRCVELYEDWIRGKLIQYYLEPCPFTINDIKEKLKGKDLLCYCSSEEPCHADVLLRIANKPG